MLLFRQFSGRKFFLREAKIEQREQEGEGRFSALILIDTVRLEAVVARASGRLDQWHAQIVAPEKPVEDELRLLGPLRVSGAAEGVETGGHGGGGLGGVLVRASAHPAGGGEA